MRIEQPQIEHDHAGYPVLVMIIDGTRTTVPSEQYMRPAGLIYLGGEMEGKVKATLPADRANGRKEDREVDGATTDAEALAIFDNYRDLMDRAEVPAEGPISRT